MHSSYAGLRSEIETLKSLLNAERLGLIEERPGMVLGEQR